MTLTLIHKKIQKNEVKFSEFGITKFNLVVFTISQWDLVLQSSITQFFCKSLANIVSATSKLSSNQNNP